MGFEHGAIAPNSEVTLAFFFSFVKLWKKYAVNDIKMSDSELLCQHQVSGNCTVIFYYINR